MNDNDKRLVTHAFLLRVCEEIGQELAETLGARLHDIEDRIVSLEALAGLRNPRPYAAQDNDDETRQGDDAAMQVQADLIRQLDRHTARLDALEAQDGPLIAKGTEDE